jgi:uncharacterized cofD-like protein
MSGSIPIETSLHGPPTKVVALGGGTGLPMVLRGLRTLVNRGEVTDLIAVVAMTDDGGSSGRLRETRGLPPPGDLRNCLTALSAEEDLLAALFQHRYSGTEEGLGGHNLGNLILAALAEQTGSFMKAVEVSSRVLRTMGRILPATLDDVVLEATLDDGTRITGETNVTGCGSTVRRIQLRPETARPTPGVVDSIREADLVVIGPGSLFTSVVPNLVVAGVGRALAETDAVVVFVANLVSDSESRNLSLRDHVEIVERHAGGPVIDAVLVHEGVIDEATLARYRAEGAYPLRWPDDGSDRFRIVRRNLLAGGERLRHDPAATAAGLIAAWNGKFARIAREAP